MCMQCIWIKICISVKKNNISLVNKFLHFYYHWCFLYKGQQFVNRDESFPWSGHYVINFVSDLQQVGGFLQILCVSSTNETDRYDMIEILLKVALNTIALTPSNVVQPARKRMYLGIVCIWGCLFFFFYQWGLSSLGQVMSNNWFRTIITCYIHLWKVGSY